MDPQLPPQPPSPGYVVIRQPTSNAAIGSLIAGIVGAFGGFCLVGLPCILAILLGHMGIAETKDGAQRGRGAAIVGLVLGYVFLIPGLTLAAIWIAGAVTS